MIASDAAALTSRWVQAYGQTEVVITRILGGASPSGATSQVSTTPIMAHVRNYSPDEIDGNIHQGDSQVIIVGAALQSLVSQLTAAGIDDALPRRNDKILLRGRERNIESADPIAMGQQLVRINLQVRG